MEQPELTWSGIDLAEYRIVAYFSNSHTMCKVHHELMCHCKCTMLLTHTHTLMPLLCLPPVQPQHFDDRVGPLGLCAAVVTALTAILICSIVDFVDFLEQAKSGGGDTPTPSPAPSPSPLPSPTLQLLGQQALGLLQAAAGGAVQTS